LTGQTSITLITVHFGPWVPWIELLLESISYNPTIKFLFFHDADYPETRPANVEFIRLSLEDLKKKLSHKLDIDISFTDPYKLCDFRATYGFVFQEYIKDAAFWGFVDNDLIWGQIRGFLSEEMLQNNDIITSWPTRIHGPFTVLRNRADINQLYEHIPDYKRILSLPKHHTADEDAFNAIVMAQKDIGSVKFCGKMMQIGDKAGSWSETLRIEAVKKGLDPKDILPPIGPSRWHNGHIYHIKSGVEAMFFHFQTWKKNWNQCMISKIALRHSDGFMIDKRGFRISYKKKSGRSIETVVSLYLDAKRLVKKIFGASRKNKKKTIK